MASFRVYMTTYNRAELCAKMLRWVRNNREGHEVTVKVFDDASWHEYDKVTKLIEDAEGFEYYRISKNRHKRGFWKTYQEMFNDAKEHPADYYVSFQDDASGISKTFFDRLDRAWEILKKKDKRAAALNYLPITSRLKKRCTWTGAKCKPVVIGGHQMFLTQMIDGHWCMPRATLEMLGFQMKPIRADRWRVNRALSSGVGQQLSERIVKQHKKNIYALDRALMKLANVPSVMNQGLRELIPLIEHNFVKE